MKAKKRIFTQMKPASIINRWEWTNARGLQVIYNNGMKCKSDYTLKELLSGKYEQVKEVIDGD